MENMMAGLKKKNIVQIQYDEYTATKTTNLAPGIDDTTPLIGEMELLCTINFTPTKIGNHLYIMANANGAAANSQGIIGGIFLDNTCVNVNYDKSSANNTPAEVHMLYKITLPNLTPFVITSRCAPISVMVGMRINGIAAGRLFGGLWRCALTAIEYDPAI